MFYLKITDNLIIPPLSNTKHLKESSHQNIMGRNSEVLQRYKDTAYFGKSPQTIRLMGCVLRRFDTYVKKPFKEATRDDVLSFFKQLQVEQMKALTIEMYRSQVKKFYKFIYDVEDGDKVPDQVSWIKVNTKRVYTYKTKADMLTEEEVLQLINACKNAQERAIIAVLYDSAIRLGELVNLKVGDIVEENGELSLCVDGKTGQRIVNLNWSESYLRQHLNEHSHSSDRNAPLWYTMRGSGFSKDGMYTHIKLIVKRTTITKRVSAHIFRHTRLTQLVGKGMPEPQTRNFAGWSKDSSMVAVYVHLNGSDVKNCLHRIEPRNQVTVEQQVEQRMQEEKQKIHDEVLAQLLETLKNPQSHVIQDYLFNQSEQQ
jgi:site-specific recombinase XerD